MSVIECSTFVTARHKESLADLLNNKLLPMFFYNSSVYGDADPFLSHVLLERPELSEFTKKDEERVNSVFFPFFADMFYSFMSEIGYPERLKLIRAAINFTFSKHDNSLEGNWHVDHKFKHGQLIIGLNDEFVGGGTEIKEKDSTIFLPTKKFTGYMFHGTEHRVIHPSKGGRLIAVFTFEDFNDDLVGTLDKKKLNNVTFSR